MITGGSAVTKDGERKPEAWLSAPQHCGEPSWPSAGKRILYVISVSRESGIAILVHLRYLFEALPCTEEEKIATCFLKKDVSGVVLGGEKQDLSSILPQK